MNSNPLQSVIRQLCRAATREQASDSTDAQLLDDFVRRHNEAAFELLVWRHAGLVLSVCRRLLHDWHEAEDAFQATFLILIRKAASISRRDALSSWLHRVALRVALRARSRQVKRPQLLAHEDIPDRECRDEILWRDLRPVLDEEINRLPEKYRRPFVLCYLQGRTNEQAARQLGCPKGTILTRLRRGRQWLQTRLTRRGVTVTSGLLAATLIARRSEAAVSAALVSATIKAAIPFAAGHAAAGLVSANTAAWTEGVLKAMFMTKLKISAAIALTITLAATGIGMLTRPVRAEPRPAQAQREQSQPRSRPDAGDARTAPRPEVRGVVKAVDADKATLTVAVGAGRQQEPMDKTFTVNKSADIALATGFSRRGSFREGKLTDLAPGALVVLQLSADQKTVEFIQAEGPTLRGAVKSVDAGRNTITIIVMMRPVRRDEEAQQEERTYTLGRKAEVAVDDGRGRLFSLKQAKLADLPAGVPVTLKLSTNLQHVQTVVAEGPTVRGVVKAVDASKRQIQLTTRGSGRGDADEEKTYDVAAGADVLLDDGKGRRFSLKEGKLADLPAGAVAVLRLAVDQKTVMIVQAEGPVSFGAVKAVDVDKRTITVTQRAARGDAPEEKTYAVAPDVRVLIDGKESKLADLKTGEDAPPVALRLSLDQKTVQSIMVGGGRR